MITFAKEVLLYLLQNRIFLVRIVILVVILVVVIVVVVVTCENKDTFSNIR